MSRLTIDELEILTPDQLLELLIDEIYNASQDVQYTQDIITVGCPIDTMDESVWMALHQAANYGKVEAVEVLISNGADINIRDKDGNTPLHYAAEWGKVEVVKFLLFKGAQVDVRNGEDKTPWNVAFWIIKERCPELRPK